MFNRSLLYAVLTAILLFLFQVKVPAQTEDRSKTLNDLDSLKKQLIEKEKQLLSPSAEDLAAYAEFLKQPNTGMIRLFPRGLYEDKLTIRGGGAYYSFFRLTHEYGYGYDIAIDQNLAGDFNNRNRLSGFEPANREYVTPPIVEYIFKTASSGANYGFIAVLGSVPLEKVTLAHKAVKFLIDYHPPSAIKEVRAEQRRMLDFGIGKNGYSYKREATATQSYTYVLRSINFDNSDVMIAFRFLRWEKDGGAVIIWKMLKQFPRPELLRPITR